MLLHGTVVRIHRAMDLSLARSLVWHLMFNKCYLSFSRSRAVMDTCHRDPSPDYPSMVLEARKRGSLGDTLTGRDTGGASQGLVMFLFLSMVPAVKACLIYKVAMRGTLQIYTLFCNSVTLQHNLLYITVGVNLSSGPGRGKWPLTRRKRGLMATQQILQNHPGLKPSISFTSLQN